MKKAKKLGGKKALKSRTIGIIVVAGLALFFISIPSYAVVSSIVNKDKNPTKATTQTTAKEELKTATPQPTQEPQDTNNSQQNPPQQTQPTNANQNSNVTTSSITANQADADAKELSRCITVENSQWQTFTERQNQAYSYRQTKYNEYLPAYTNGLITKAEYDDLMNKTYNYANDKIRQAYQMYYDAVIGQRCTNVKQMPQLIYYKG